MLEVFHRSCNLSFSEIQSCRELWLHRVLHRGFEQDQILEKAVGASRAFGVEMEKLDGREGVVCRVRNTVVTDCQLSKPVTRKHSTSPESTRHHLQTTQNKQVHCNQIYTHYTHSIQI